MSLVREALAKAEREAAARAARERGLPPERADLAQPYRAPRRRRWPWTAGLVAAALAGAGVAYVLAGSRERAAPSPSGRSETSSLPDPSDASNGGHGSAVDSIVAPASSVSSSPAPPLAAVESGGTDAKALVAAAAAAPVASAATLPPAAAEPDAGAATGSYVREVALGGGRAIRLGGIAWSETAPVAYLNGRLRGVGEVVEGWEITEIARDRVALAAGARRVEITLR